MLSIIKNKFSYYKKYIFDALSYRVLKRGVNSDFWARIYYAFFDKSFVRENRSVLTGKWVHQEGFKTGELNEYKIRRNIHRLEKGIIMPERRKVFAKDYIMETVMAYKQEKNKPQCNESLINWTRDVLTLYFSIVEHEGEIAKAHKAFKEEKDGATGVPDMLPHKRIVDDHLSLNYDEFLNLCKKRVSTRIFKDKPVSRELLQKAFHAALFSPSACNRQPFEFIIFDKKKDIQKYINLPGGITGFEKGVPALLFIIGDLSAYFHEKDRHLIYIDGGLVAMSLMLALESLGLSSCALNWPDIEEKEITIEKKMKLPKHKRCIMAMTIGYPHEKGGVPFSLKKSINDITQFEIK